MEDMTLGQKKKKKKEEGRGRQQLSWENASVSS